MYAENDSLMLKSENGRTDSSKGKGFPTKGTVFYMETNYIQARYFS